MTVSGLWVLQKGLLSLLSQNTGLQALLGNTPRIYDVPSPSPAYPFILIGTMSGEQWGARDIAGAKITLTIHAYADANRGSGDIKAINDVLRAALDNQNVPLDSGQVILCQYAGSEPEELMPDGINWRGTVKFNILMQN